MLYLGLFPLDLDLPLRLPIGLLLDRRRPSYEAVLIAAYLAERPDFGTYAGIGLFERAAIHHLFHPCSMIALYCPRHFASAEYLLPFGAAMPPLTSVISAFIQPIHYLSYLTIARVFPLDRWIDVPPVRHTYPYADTFPRLPA
jgi:hypothetical protein